MNVEFKDIEIKGVVFKGSKRPSFRQSPIKEALSMLSDRGRRSLIAVNQTCYCLPTSDWIAKFASDPRYAETFDGIDLSLRDVMEKTLDITSAAVSNSSYFSTSLPSAGEYQSLLSDYLMNLNVRWEMVKDENDIIRIVEVSTEFYNELRAQFRHMRLSDYEIKSIRLAGWIHNDMMVDVTNDVARQLR